jgi:hypothetical protein
MAAKQTTAMASIPVDLIIVPPVLIEEPQGCLALL